MIYNLSQNWLFFHEDFSLTAERSEADKPAKVHKTILLRIKIK
jgi:hypothetical protein